MLSFCSALFTLNLINTNDESPVFEDLPYNFTIPESNKSGELIGTVSASDKDDLELLVYTVDDTTMGKVIDQYTLKIAPSFQINLFLVFSVHALF